MEKELANHDIQYLHIEKLGGRRKEKRNDNTTSENMKKICNNYGWENKSFRAYADYMCTLEFREGIDELLSLKKQDEEKKYDNNSYNIAIMIKYSGIILNIISLNKYKQNNTKQVTISAYS
jgi:hypothetical protein